MSKIEEILSTPTADAIKALMQKSVEVPTWAKLKEQYDPSLHQICTDRIGRKDKVGKRGNVEKVARISVPVEQLLTKRMTEFTFAIPVQRNYSNVGEDATKKEVSATLEKIFKVARIDSENIKRGRAYYASCEVVTIWYTTESKNNLYGFPSNFKLKCDSYSPLDGYELYPLFDEHGDMIAMSVRYSRKVVDKDEIYFETYTQDRHIKWQVSDENRVLLDEKIGLGKIPCVYMYRKAPIYDGIETMRSEIEYTLSRNSDVVAYNAAPIIKVSGAIEGVEEKGESRRIIKVENGGDVSYVSWSQASEAVKWHVDEMFRLIFMQTQMPDISFDNFSHIGAIGYDARKTLLTDAHLKVGDESGAILEFLDRDVNVVKAFLKLMKPEWREAIDEVDVENIITPYIQDDDSQNIQKVMTGNGGKPIFSQLESIRLAGYSTDPQATLDQINKETQDAQQRQMALMMMGGTMQ